MGLLRGSWSEVFTLSILFRSLPTTVAAAGLAAKEVSNGVKRKLKFAPDYAMTQTIANQCGLQAFYEQVLSYIHIRRPVPSTDQALPSCFYFRIS